MADGDKPILLITGSRHSTPAMDTFAERMVMATLMLDRFYPSCFGASIIVGDAEGIDDVVVRMCQTLGLEVACFGITVLPRNSCMPRYYQRLPGLSSFLARDDYMAMRCDLCLAIWNGITSGQHKSTGTVYTYKAALRHGKKARLITSFTTIEEDERREREKK